MEILNTTDYCVLPSRGELYPETSPFYKKEKVAFHDITTTEEDIMANKTLIKNGVAFDRVLQNCLEEPNASVNDLTISDKQALLMCVRINSYGPEYKISLQCPECGKRQDLPIKLDESLENSLKFVKPLSETLEFYKYCDLTRLSHDTFSFITRKSGYKVVFRVGLGSDEHTLFKIEEKKNRERTRGVIPKEEIDRGAVMDTLKMFIVSINGIEEKGELHEIIAHLHSRDSHHIREVYREVSCQIRMMTTFTCVDEENCGYEHEVEVPLKANFFRHDSE